MPDLSVTLKSLADRWRSEGVKLTDPLAPDSVEAALNKTGRKFSPDVVELYSTVGGMTDWGTDHRCWSFWTLDRVITENAFYTQRELAFADFLINAHVYTFKVESDLRSSVWIDHFSDDYPPEQVAETVVEFFETLLNNPGSLQMFDLGS